MIENIIGKTFSSDYLILNWEGKKISGGEFKVPIISIIIVVSFTSFLALMISGMLVYEGGNFNDHNYSKYSFQENYLSDLGRDYTYTGELNTVPQLLFRLAMMSASIAIISIYAFLIHSLRKLEEKSKLGIAGAVFGLFSTIFCTSVAFVSFDTYVTLHRICTYFFGFFVLTANILHIISFYKIKEYPNNYCILFIICSALLLVYILVYTAIGFDAPYLQEVTKILGQKIVIGAAFINLGIQAYGFNKGLSKLNEN